VRLSVKFVAAEEGVAKIIRAHISFPIDRHRHARISIKARDYATIIRSNHIRCGVVAGGRLSFILCCVICVLLERNKIQKINLKKAMAVLSLFESFRFELTKYRRMRRVLLLFNSCPVFGFRSVDGSNLHQKNGTRVRCWCLVRPVIFVLAKRKDLKSWVPDREHGHVLR